MLTFFEQVCPTIILSGHTNEESQDSVLHKVYASSHMIRGRDETTLQQMFKNNVLESHEALMASAQADFIIPNNF